MIALCIALCAAGHLVRDGWPATGSTQLARFLGGILCFAGARAVHSPHDAAIIGAAIWLGFYLDQKHGDGQGANNWASAGYLALSGVTSLLLLAGVAAWLTTPAAALLALAGLAKVPIWFGWWRIKPDSWWPWLYPTRAAAITFGAIVGTIAWLA